jgi:hypothetical protein
MLLTEFGKAMGQEAEPDFVKERVWAEADFTRYCRFLQELQFQDVSACIVSYTSSALQIRNTGMLVVSLEG